MTDTIDCRHCGDAIVLEPYFRDGRLPNPPVWCHVNGGRACALRDWPADKPWPLAAPKES